MRTLSGALCGGPISGVTIIRGRRPRSLVLFLLGFKKHSVVNARAFHFSNSVINNWNSLNYSQVHACSVAAFKTSLTCVDKLSSD